MKITAFAVAAVVLLAGCMNDPDGNSPSGTDGKDDGMPRLYSELDSIVINQLDFLYYTNKWAEPQDAFSEAALELLTDDTLLFHRDTVYPFDSGNPIVETFVRTKFNPTGWLAFHDSQNSMTCTPSEAEPTGEWLIRIDLDPGIHRACYRTSGGSPSMTQLWVMHYRDKGFVFNVATVMGDRDFGAARLYYWR